MTATHDGRLRGRARVLVPASLLVSYLANDGEELLTMASTSPAALARLPRWIPVPARHARLSKQHVNVAVGLMGVLYAAAAADGWRTAGRSPLYQDVQLVFGLHGFGHLAAAAATRGYTTGVATSPTVVIPQGWWARRSLRHAGVPDSSHPVRAAAVVGGWLAASHALAAWLTRGER